ncbi:MAG: response regulator [Phycisphaerae bacterium]|nr:response regulator [Phycisphaerae bacterium]
MNPQQIKIAVISNDEAQASTAADVLSGKGYQISRYQNPDQLVSEVAGKSVHVALVDENLPADTMDLVGQLKEADRQLSVILMGSQLSVDTAVRGMQLGVCDYLAKPINGDRLLKAVETALGRRGMFLTSPETINKIIGSRLRDIRRDSDLTTQQLADRVGVTQSQISQIETGRSAASVVTLYRISHALGMNLSSLLEGI